MKIVQHNPVVDLTVIVDKIEIGFKLYEESTVPIRVNKVIWLNPICYANPCQSESVGVNEHP